MPSESEWEFAARSGGQDITYPWGNETPTCQYAVMNDSAPYNSEGNGCGEGSTWPVCGKTAGNTMHGLCDMAGNVSEWVQDVFHGSYDCDANPGTWECDSGGVAPTDGSAWEVPHGEHRVLRGGTWYNDADNMRATGRELGFQELWSEHYGFRCAHSM